MLAAVSSLPAAAASRAGFAAGRLSLPSSLFVRPAAAASTVVRLSSSGTSSSRSVAGCWQQHTVYAQGWRQDEEQSPHRRWAGPIGMTLGLGRWGQGTGRAAASSRGRMTTVRMMSTSSRSSSSGSAPQERREQESKDGGAVSSGSGKPCCGASSSHSSHTATTAQKEAGKGTRGGKGAAGGFLSRELLSKFTVAASILCAIDCTVFPALLAILPAAEVLGDPQWGGVDLHELSHQAALYVVLPIGSLTTLSNYVLHKDKPLAALSCAGLALILGSNASFEWLPAVLHESRLWNTLGCGTLIGSSYLAHRRHDDHHSHGDCHNHSPGKHDGEGEEGGAKGK